MKQVEVDLTITQDDDKAYNLEFTRADGTPLDISNSTVTMTARRAKTGGTVALEKIVTSHADPEAGKTTITLESTDTNIALGNYYYDIQIEGTDIGQKTVMKGKLEITWQVTE